MLLAMAPGLGVKEAAEVLGISEATARAHLQRMYVKTGTAKYTELMQLLMSSAPPVIDTGNASWLVREHRLEDAPFIVTEFIAHHSKLLF